MTNIDGIIAKSQARHCAIRWAFGRAVKQRKDEQQIKSRLKRRYEKVLAREKVWSTLGAHFGGT
eukprot:2555116-Amphidinium_carterae.1